MSFENLQLSPPILRAVASEGYTVATPIQVQAIPHILAGSDLMGCAQTGTGKTAAFALPVLHRLAGGPTSPAPKPRCLVLCPTRELATQTGDSFRVYGKHLHLRHTVIFGGVGYGPQIQALRRGVDIIVAAPGRLLDLLRQGYADLRSIEVLILDEADRMLDMGFIHDIKEIISRLPAKRQTLLFSATLPNDIRRLAGAILRNPVNVSIASATPTAERIEQSVYHVARRNKPALLAHLVRNVPMTRAIVFTRTKRGADRLVQSLHHSGIGAEAIHGNKSQNVRQRALDNFRANRLAVLVATDVASRGIDVDGITHVVNFDITDEPETYVHRIGRTARAGASGGAISFCDPEEMSNLRAIEKLLRQPIPVKTDHPGYVAAPVVAQGLEGNQSRQGQPSHRASQPHPATPRRHPSARPHAPERTPSSGTRRPAHAPAGTTERAKPRPVEPTGRGVVSRHPKARRIPHPLHG